MKTWSVVAALLAAAALAGCDPDEQGRPLSFSGSYAGPAKPPLSEDKLRVLAARAELQRGIAPALASPPEPQAVTRPPARAGQGMSPWGTGASVRVGNGS